MPYFSRLTDIVTCNLTSILDQADDPRAALEEIIFEMQEGVAGAKRSVNTANKNVSQLEIEIGEQRTEIGNWMTTAQAALEKQEESKARQALERKHEVEDLIAGLEQQLEAAISTRDHLHTMQNALQARLADATRRLRAIGSGEEEATSQETQESLETAAEPSDRQCRVDAELEALRKQMKTQ